MNLKHSAIISIAVSLASLLTACGQTGPLYLPAKPAPAAVPAKPATPLPPVPTPVDAGNPASR